MPARVTVILNASAGSGRTGPSPDELGRVCAGAGLVADIEVTGGEDIAARARRALEAGSRIVVAAGGDGTVSAVASILARHDAALGILPLGTLNHFAKELGIPLGLDEAVGVVAAGHRVAIDIAEVNGRNFLNNSSLGAYPSLVWEREREEQKGRSYTASLALAIARVWRDYRRVRVVVKGAGQARVVRTPFVFVGNNEYQLEGIKIGKRKRLDAGCLHLCMAPDMTRGDVFRVLLAALAGRLDAIDRFESITATEFSIEAWRHRLRVSLDGELAVLETPLHYQIHPRALCVIVPV